MMKILCIVMFAASLIGGASVVMAQSSRDLTEPTGTEANRLKTQYGGYYGGYRGYAYSPPSPTMALVSPVPLIAAIKTWSEQERQSHSLGLS